jgi:hypothetical protein
MGPYRRPYGFGFGRPGRFIWGAPFVGGLVGGLVGSALFNPYFYGGYGGYGGYPFYRPPFYPYGGGFWY